jgi:putative DNA-invertase from lambdoid prophage Rac
LDFGHFDGNNRHHKRCCLCPGYPVDYQSAGRKENRGQNEMRTALYLRVSTKEQHTDNQLQPLEQFCKSRGFEIVKVYAENESAWRMGHQAELARLLHAAETKHFDVVVVWALDRLTRSGTMAILQIINRLHQYGVRVISCQESFTERSFDETEPLYSMMAWVARMESQRRSERTRAGLERARAEGKGRRGIDKKPRKKRIQKRPVVFTPEVQAW